jgi:hypothetical protein
MTPLTGVEAGWASRWKLPEDLQLAGSRDSFGHSMPTRNGRDINTPK